jgi:hypothetical protein
MVLRFGHFTSASLRGVIGDELGQRFLDELEQRLSRKVGFCCVCVCVWGGGVNAGLSVGKMKLPIVKEINRKEIEHSILSS